MKNDKVEKIMELDTKIEDIIFKTTSSYIPHEKQKLNGYDKKK